MKLTLYTVLSAAFLVFFLISCGGGGGGGSSDGVTTSPPGSVVDTAPPYVVSTYPVLNSTAVKTNRAITVTFNEAIESTTVTSSTFLVDNAANGDIITGTVEYDSSSLTATFRNTEDLSPATSYVATITTDVEDLAGNRLSEDYVWQFTTQNATDAIDNTSPTVQSRFPAPNAPSVAPNVAISVTFDEPIDPSTINTNTVVLNDGTSSVSGTVSYIGKTAMFEPATDLSVNTNYTATVTENIKDLAGNSLGTSESWNFTTSDIIDVQTPSVLSVSPPDGAVNVPIDSSLVVTFNEAIMPFEFGLIDGWPVTVTFNDTYTVVTMTPTAGLSPGVSYNASVLVSDQAGNLMVKRSPWVFTTAP